MESKKIPDKWTEGKIIRIPKIEKIRIKKKVPDEWTDMKIIKIPKKGNIRDAVTGVESF